MLVATAGALTVAGRSLGVVELYGLAAGVAGLVCAAVAFVRLGEIRLEAGRQLRPPRVHAGNASRVELTLRNRQTARTPLLVAVDPFDRGRRWARFLVAPLRPGEQARAAYRLPTDRRGVFPLGPLELRREDPFGIAAATAEAAPMIELTVYPRIDDIDPLPFTLGQDPMAGGEHATSLGPSGDEFYALREYEIGDDLRRVHWKSTAKLGELMIRQDEMPWQGRATIVLDLRQSVHTEDSLELAVSAAASIVTASWRQRSLLRLVTTDGSDSGFASGRAHMEAILERLALVSADPRGNLVSVLGSLRRGGNSGVLTVITTDAASNAELSASARLGSRFGEVFTVLFERASHEPARPALGTVVRVTSSNPFPAAWAAAIGARHRPRARPRLRL